MTFSVKVFGLPLAKYVNWHVITAQFWTKKWPLFPRLIFVCSLFLPSVKVQNLPFSEREALGTRMGQNYLICYREECFCFILRAGVRGFRSFSAAENKWVLYPFYPLEKTQHKNFAIWKNSLVTRHVLLETLRVFSIFLDKTLDPFKP